MDVRPQIPTLASVARLAGVSTSTASRVLNRSEVSVPISNKTRERVLLAARESGYAPSAAARALRSGSTKTLGVIGTSPEFFQIGIWRSSTHASFVGEILSGLLDAAIGRGYNLTLLTGSEARSGSEMELLASFGLSDGLLVLNRDLGAEDICASALRLYGKPLVYLLDYREGDAFVSAPDDFEGGRLATQELLRRGHRSIGFVRAPGFDDIMQRRQRGWASVLEENGIRPIPVVEDVATLAPGDIQSLGCTAALCANRPCASQFAALCASAGIPIPGRMEIIGFFHTSGSLSEAIAHHETETEEFGEVLCPLADIVSAGVNLLIELVEGRRPATARILFPYTIRHGASCPSR